MHAPTVRGRRASYEEMLRRHIAAAGKRFSTEELVAHLRSRHPCYARHKLRPFTKRVESTIRASRSRRRRTAAADGDSPTAKRRRFVVSSSSSSASPSGNSPYYDDFSDKETAASGEKSELAFDLLKSTMREELSRKSMRIVVHEELELETADGKAANLRREKDKIEREARVCSKEPMLKDFGGINELMKELKKKVLWPFYHPELPRVDGAEPITGILLKGPPGCGKSTLARAMANEKGVPLFEVSAAELVSGVSGESEQNIRELFSKAQSSAPSIVFIDEIDSIASKRENSNRGMEQRIVTQLMASMDESHKLVFDKNGYVLVIGATNNPDSIDSALRRPGRFDLEFFLGVPDEKARAQILSNLLCNAGVDGTAFDVLKIARSTPGFVGADLKAVIRAASNLATSRPLEKRVAECSKTEEYCGCCRNCLISPLLDEEKENMNITMADIEEAVKIVQPSSKREGFSAIPDVTWDDVGGLRFLREEFYYDIVALIKSPQYYEELGMDLATGFLLYGPPGCGKTLVAQAVANEAGANFIYIKGPELLNKYVGESELAVRTLFSRARTCSPCILFIDEVDALTRDRGKEGSSVIQQVVNQLLIEMDGSEKRKGVYVIGTTNRPDVMDPALLRPGRFGNLVYVPLPRPEERGMILKALARKKAVDPNVDLMALGMDSRCHNFSGADLSKLMHRAARAALKDKLLSKKASATRLTIKDEHFIRALDEMSPSVSDKQIQEYKLLSQSFKS